MTQSKWVRVGSVRRFDHVEADKAQALKPLEEAAEVFGAWQAWQENGPTMDNTEAGLVDRIIAECADVIQSTLNLVAAMGVEDFRPYMKACERRNRERGRITDGRLDDVRYGLPYRGSKSTIAEWVVDVLPASHTPVDLCSLLRLADELEEDACWEVQTPGDTSGAWRLKDTCDRIRDALGVVE